MVIAEFTFVDWLMFVIMSLSLIVFLGLLVYIIRECTKDDKFSLEAVVLYITWIAYFSALVTFGMHFAKENQLL